MDYPYNISYTSSNGIQMGGAIKTYQIIIIISLLLAIVALIWKIIVSSKKYTPIPKE